MWHNYCTRDKCRHTKIDRYIPCFPGGALLKVGTRNEKKQKWETETRKWDYAWESSCARVTNKLKNGEKYYFLRWTPFLREGLACWMNTSHVRVVIDLCIWLHTRWVPLSMWWWLCTCKIRFYDRLYEYLTQRWIPFMCEGMLIQIVYI